jgi:hypothetical protein
MFNEIRHGKKRAFLAAVAETANIKKSAEIAKIDRTSHYIWLHNDLAYRRAFEVAKLRGADSLEAEAVRRAHEGVAEPVFYQGHICGEVQKYSDTLLIFLMKGANPEKYHDRHEVSGSLNLDTINAKLIAGRDRMKQAP